MDIGRIVSVYTVEPVVSPVPHEREQVAVAPQPEPAPAEPTWAPSTPVENR
jgi:hypothetical protein